MKEPSHAAADTPNPATPIEALRASPDFRGPVESLDETQDNDRFALVYESAAERVSATAPFVEQGLERGEQCVYVVDGQSERALRSALRERGVDVDAALDSNALRVETIRQTGAGGGRSIPTRRSRSTPTSSRRRWRRSTRFDLSSR